MEGRANLKMNVYFERNVDKSTDTNRAQQSKNKPNISSLIVVRRPRKPSFISIVDVNQEIYKVLQRLDALTHVS